MKLLFCVYLSVLFFSLFSCQNDKRVENENSLSIQREKSKLVVEYRILSNVKYLEDRNCIEKLASCKNPKAEVRFLFPKNISELGLDTAYQEDSYFIHQLGVFNKPIFNEDENYRIYVMTFDYMVSLVVFEDKRTKNRTFTITGKAKGIFWINSSYWIVGNDCHMGCSMSIERIKDPKLLKPTKEQNLDSLRKQLQRLPYEEKMKIVRQEGDELLFSANDTLYNGIGKKLSGFIPYQNSMILVFEQYKSNKYRFIQVNEDKSVEHIDSLVNGKFDTRQFSEDDMITILPKNQSLISLCQTIFKIENDTLFVYSLR
ncbi:hypothetical protein WAF17_01400 [Bernardetia sp. ABR2-2B]|uniref:hypothetical protein n=1 Tax=Bernardetia sp. ABR2-2B TaxID=3127472 RepID=UPI0030CCEFF1